MKQLTMSSNFSRLSGSPCYVLTPYTSENSSTYYPETFTTCVITAVLAPVTVTGNALILAAIWKNPSLRTPSYVLLAGLAVTDFCTGLLTQPVYILSLVSVLTGNRKMRCITAPVSNGLGYYFSALTFTLIVMTAVERAMAAYEPTISSYCATNRYFLCNLYSWFYSFCSGRHVQFVFLE